MQFKCGIVFEVPASRQFSFPLTKSLLETYVQSKKQRSPFSDYILNFFVWSGVNPDLCLSKDFSETCHSYFLLTHTKNNNLQYLASNSVLRISFGHTCSFPCFYIFALCGKCFIFCFTLTQTISAFHTTILHMDCR